MNKVLRKTRKLLKDPKAFFADSKLLKSKETTDNTHHISPSKKNNQAQKDNKKKYTAYFNENFTSSAVFKEHLTKIIESEANIVPGDYRIKNDQVLFKKDNDVFICKITQPVENEQLIKGVLPFKSDVLLSVNNKNTSEFLRLLHLLNVKHMKVIGDFNMLYEYYSDRPESNEQSQIKYALSAGIYTEDIINRSILLINSKYLTLPMPDLVLIFRKLYRVVGTDPRLESIANKLAASIRKQVYSVPFTMLLAAFFTESGEYEKAIEMALKAKSKESDAWSKHRYLGLTYLLYKNCHIEDEWAKQDSALFLELSKNEWEFEGYITENHQNINIIGNAPNEIGFKKGNLIDLGDKVARFNGAITDFPHCVDYGKKTNVLIINPRYYETQRNNKFGLDYIVISDGNLYSSKNIAYKLHDLFHCCDKITFIPRRIDIALTQKIAASPSSGLKFMEWIFAVNGKIPAENLYGFSLVDQGHGVATSYSKGRRVGLNTIHNWSNEQLHMDSLLLKKEQESA